MAFADLGSLTNVALRAWSHQTPLDASADNFYFQPVGADQSSSWGDDFSSPSYTDTGWTSDSSGTGGEATSTNGKVSFTGTTSGMTYGSILHDLSVNGNFTTGATFTQNANPGETWRDGIYLQFQGGMLILHDTGESGWYLYSWPTGGSPVVVWNGSVDTSGQLGTQTLTVERVGDQFRFSVARGGIETELYSQEFTGLGGLTGVRLAAWSHGSALNAAVDEYFLTVT
ncbi:MAG: hypothetical protein K8U57_29770 [Planctomycetes bacterium]|nr:hypothetical protein [Planctomycetota bacterium]